MAGSLVSPDAASRVMQKAFHANLTIPPEIYHLQLFDYSYKWE
jgi:hypothetical protein